ncbi:hypothetical protein [Fluviispira sanaruensis]|uniref:Uncharacterized protein n=1 Tax=Fluviispira sanaruensis TaxID=2493639 RepID=A0A4P2VP69_FLUSA|nr:hypothetical protein [Fluviispira sanaruensis]BBH53509.1 hypothetical protein JCM31447_19530 [Fluviispira sanaruensis]
MEKSKIVKYLILAFLLLFYIESLFSLENPTARPPSTQGDSFLLPPVRRVGIDILESNVDKFRIFMRKQDRVLYGTPALPFSETELRKDLVADVDEEIQNTGRFWSLSLSDFMKLIPLSGSAKKSPENVNAENLRVNLESDYNLDAWIRPSIYFAPDQTLVRVSVRGAGIMGSIWAREDVMIEPQASRTKIKEAFAQAVARLIATLGHDGKVTYMRENLLTVDFGKERGIVRGETLYAGYVILSSFHPQTGEFLRANRIPIHSLKVLEARQGSSLCQIVSSDRVSYEQALKILDKQDVQLLVWKKEQKLNNTGWRDPYNPDTAPMLGAAEEGFESQTKREKMRSMLPPVIFGKDKQEKNAPVPMENDKQDINNLEKDKTARLDKKSEIALAQEENSKPQAEQQGLISPQLPPNEGEEVEVSKPKKKISIDEPNSWDPTSLRIGVALTSGSYFGNSAGIPTTLINTFNASGKIDIDSTFDLYINPYAQFSFFNGSTIQGSSYFVGLGAYKVLWRNPVPSGVFRIGGALEYMGGSVLQSDAAFNISKISVFANGRWSDNLDNIGEYEFLGGFSFFDFIQGKSVWALEADLRPFRLMTKELLFRVLAKRFQDGWFEVSIGVSWDFLPSDSYNLIKGNNSKREYF